MVAPYFGKAHAGFSGVPAKSLGGLELTTGVDIPEASVAALARTDSAAAEAARPGASSIARGTNQVGVRRYNERLVLSQIRRHRNLAKAEIARQTGLSAQTITVIMRELEADGLVTRKNHQRGKVGQPSIPFDLDPDGAFALGLKVGRRRTDLVLIDFAGNVRSEVFQAAEYPTPASILSFVSTGVPEVTKGLTRRQARRIAGLGIAAPFELWNWEDQIGAPRDVLDQWRSFDLRNDIAGRYPWPVYFCNDATAACAAELMLGNPEHHADFLYFFIGSFIGGGVVLNGQLVLGPTGNAGAIGSMPTLAADGSSTGRQLIRSASLYLLANRLAESGSDPTVLWRSPENWGSLGAPLEDWIEAVVQGLAFAVVAAISVVDFPSVIVDGAVPAAVRRDIVARTSLRLREFDLQGLSPVDLVEGSIGPRARAIGGACLPLLASFARDREVMFKDSVVS